jgi:hypothetical protein
MKITMNKKTLEGFNKLTINEQKTLDLMRQVQQEFINQGFDHPSDKDDMITAVHLIQTIIMRQVARRIIPDIFPKK